MSGFYAEINSNPHDRGGWHGRMIKMKQMDKEPYIGTIDQIREHFSRKWCVSNGIDEDKWKHIAPSSIDGLKIRNIESGFEMYFWAGGSGTNNMAIDSKGGCHDLSFHREFTFEALTPNATDLRN